MKVLKTEPLISLGFRQIFIYVENTDPEGHSDKECESKKSEVCV